MSFENVIKRNTTSIETVQSDGIFEPSLGPQFIWEEGELYIDASIDSSISIGVSQEYVDGSLALRDLSILNLSSYNSIQDASIIALEASIGSGGVSQEYVDGSLALRDLSILNLSSYNSIQDASIIALEASIGSGGVSQEYVDGSLNLKADISYVDANLDNIRISYVDSSFYSNIFTGMEGNPAYHLSQSVSDASMSFLVLRETGLNDSNQVGEDLMIRSWNHEHIGIGYKESSIYHYVDNGIQSFIMYLGPLASVRPPQRFGIWTRSVWPVNNSDRNYQGSVSLKVPTNMIEPGSYSQPQFSLYQDKAISNIPIDYDSSLLVADVYIPIEDRLNDYSLIHKKYVDSSLNLKANISYVIESLDGKENIIPDGFYLKEASIGANLIWVNGVLEPSVNILITDASILAWGELRNTSDSSIIFYTFSTNESPESSIYTARAWNTNGLSENCIVDKNSGKITIQSPGIYRIDFNVKISLFPHIIPGGSTYMSALVYDGSSNTYIDPSLYFYSDYPNPAPIDPSSFWNYPLALYKYIMYSYEWQFPREFTYGLYLNGIKIDEIEIEEETQRFSRLIEIINPNSELEFKFDVSLGTPVSSSVDYSDSLWRRPDTTLNSYLDSNIGVLEFLPYGGGDPNPDPSTIMEWCLQQATEYFLNHLPNAQDQYFYFDSSGSPENYDRVTPVSLVWGPNGFTIVSYVLNLGYDTSTLLNDPVMLETNVDVSTFTLLGYGPEDVSALSYNPYSFEDFLIDVSIDSSVFLEERIVKNSSLIITKIG